MDEIKKGCKVKCIDDHFNTENLLSNILLPKKGELYKVREVVVNGDGLLLEEISLSYLGKVYEPAFRVGNFIYHSK